MTLMKTNMSPFSLGAHLSLTNRVSVLRERSHFCSSALSRTEASGTETSAFNSQPFLEGVGGFTAALWGWGEGGQLHCCRQAEACPEGGEGVNDMK